MTPKIIGIDMININDNDRVLFIGDSITDIKFNTRFHYKLKGRKVYALNVAKEIKKRHKGVKCYFRGIASNRTYHVYDRLTKDCISLKPNVIVMLIGVNDAWEHYVPEQYPPLLRPMEPHIDEIYRRLKAELPEAKLLILLPFMIDTMEEKLPFHKVLDEYREVLRQKAEQNGAEIIDLQEMFYTVQKDVAPKLLATDGIHPTNLGHKYISDEILKSIN